MLLCFDYDGVISDSIDQITNVAKQAQEIIGKGRPPTVDDIKTNNPMTIDNFARKIGIPDKNVKDFFNTYFDILVNREEKNEPFSGIIDVLKELSKWHTIVIITANLKLEVLELLERYEANHTVSLIFDARDPEDKTEKILKAIDTFKEEKTNTVMIGDTTSDIKYGKRAGVKTIAVSWGYHSKESLLNENPNFIANTPAELFKTINSLNINLSIWES